VDYTAFAQDAASISQVGRQGDKWQAREVRLDVEGAFGSFYKVKYYVNAVAGDYVDTSDIPADHAWHLGLEAFWNQVPFSVLVEYNRAWVDSPATQNPEFYGYYILGSWVLTGENRPYDHTVGYTGRIFPQYHWGAPELVARFSRVDLIDGPVQGGKFYKTYLGVNWWMSRQWKLGFGWGHSWLDRFGTTGITDSFLTRLQWVF